MSIHFLVTGYLFYWAIIGIDPGPRRLPFLGRLGLLFAVMPFHAFFGIATMTMNSVIGDDFYGFLKLPWMTDLQHDQFLGGAIAWGASEVPVVIVVIALVSQWAASDRRAAPEPTVRPTPTPTTNSPPTTRCWTSCHARDAEDTSSEGSYTDPSVPLSRNVISGGGCPGAWRSCGAEGCWTPRRTTRTPWRRRRSTG